MENAKQVDSSSPLPSSFANDLFGASGSSPSASSNGVFSSIFAVPSTVKANNYSASKIVGNEHKLHSGSLPLDAKGHGNMIKDMEGDNNNISSKEVTTIFQERLDPCPLSSSLYYGGQEDMYIKSSSPHTSGSYINYKKDGVDDPSGNNSNDASRGNWWKGSLYY